MVGVEISTSGGQSTGACKNVLGWAPAFDSRMS